MASEMHDAEEDRSKCGRASMRPRRDGLGNGEREAAPLRPCLRFNEAEARWPRKSTSWRGQRSGCRRFNEAEARWPRKSAEPSRSGPRGRRFNEAEARWPRKSDAALRLPVRSSSASMRPRRDGLGNTAQRGIDFTRLAGFNEAEARWPRKWGLRRRNPSGSPRFNEAEARWPRK